jgi:copper chaperone CopZ
MRKVTLRITGMTCSKCLERVSETVRGFPEVRDLSIEPSEGLFTLIVTERFELQRVKGAIELCGEPRHNYEVFEVTRQSLK